jgi:lipoprotein-releasing system ATP-binding protein
MTNSVTASAGVPQKNSPVLLCQQLTKIYDENRADAVPVLQNIDFALHAGEHVAIMGTSGSGKSTLLHLLAGLDRPTSGSIQLMGQSLTGLSEQALGELRNRYVGFVYQFHHLLPELTALENVLLPLWLPTAFPRSESRKQMQARCIEWLSRVGLASRLTHKPDALSGGERQRVALVRALITQPACVLADEPTGNLDSNTALQVQQLMTELSRDVGTAFLVVTHDAHFAAQAERILYLHHGRLSDEAM